MTNPLLQDWTTPFGLPPFAAIADDHFAPALETALLVATTPAIGYPRGSIVKLQGSPLKMALSGVALTSSIRQ